MIYLFLGCVAVWTLISVYLAYLGAQQRQLAREISWLRERLPARQD